jgi:hypothetical protein
MNHLQSDTHTELPHLVDPYKDGLSFDPECGKLTVQPLRNLRKKLQDMKQRQFDDIVAQYKTNSTIKNESLSITVENE